MIITYFYKKITIQHIKLHFMSIDCFKYLSVNLDDRDWELSVINAGCTDVKENNLYPKLQHPPQYNLSWSDGRFLNEYQFIYITKGRGIFESESGGQYTVKAGTLIILFPGDRHRYRPDVITGWKEHWIGINGPYIDSLVAKGYFKRHSPCIHIGFNEEVLRLFYYILENAKEEKFGYQPLIAGAAIHLLGCLHYIQQQQNISPNRYETIINHAKLIFRSKIYTDFSPEDVAKELEIGYSFFRKIFKDHTGISPGQYFLSLKINQAKQLLNDPEKMIKEIAFELGFSNCFYFSKIFKEKTGVSPMKYRQYSEPNAVISNIN